MEKLQMEREGLTTVKPCTLKELSEIYGVNWRTVKLWLEPFDKDIGEKRGRFYTALQVKIIFEKLGFPFLMEAA